MAIELIDAAKHGTYPEGSGFILINSLHFIDTQTGRILWIIFEICKKTCAPV